MSEPVAPPAGSELAHDAQWRRLDLRMLLVHPVNEVIRFLPVIIGIFFLGTSGEGDGYWHYLGVAIPVAIGVFRFASTRFRITPGQIELRRGLLSRSVLTAPLDRVRTVELTASPIHRILGLEKVEIGTGSATRSGDGRLVLDSLGADEARRLRGELLQRSSVGAGPAEAAYAPEAAGETTVLLRFDSAWVRYAPLTGSGVAIALAAVGALSGPFFGNGVVVRVEDSSLLDRLDSFAVPMLVGGGLVALLVVTSVLAMVGYLLANWGFVLVRDDARRTYHVRRGALTTRETSIDLARLRGVEMHEPLVLRLAGGARLEAVATGLDRRAEGGNALVPSAPRPIVLAVGDQVLGEPGLLASPLTLHGAAARRRRRLRATVPVLLLAGALLVLWQVAGWPWWLAVAALLALPAGLWLAADRYAGLGHALTAHHLVVRSGSLQGRRDALQRTGIIGWNITQTFFQRRAGLCTLTATTAAGKQAYHAVDIPQDVAVRLADTAVPGLIGQFVE